MDLIRLEGMVFYAYHGVFGEETKLGQRFSVDIELHLDLADAVGSDDVTDTVDYGAVYDLTKTIVEGEPRKLIEAVAGRVCQAILETFPRVDRAVVEISKPSAPIPGIFNTVSTRVDRSRAKA